MSEKLWKTNLTEGNLRGYTDQNREKCGLQEKTEHKKRGEVEAGAEGENPELGCTGLRLHLPLYLHTLVSLHPLSRGAPVHEGRPQPQPQLCASRPLPALLLLTRLQEAGLRVTCPVLPLLLRTGGSDGPSISEGPTPQGPLAAGLFPGPSHPPAHSSAPLPPRLPLCLLESTADSTRPFPARHCRPGLEELPFLRRLPEQSNP